MANRRLQQQGAQTEHMDRCVGDLLTTAGNLGGNLDPQPVPDFPAPVVADADAHDVLLLHTDTTPLPQDSVSSILLVLL